MSDKRKEKQRLKELGIVFVTAILPDQFPKHLFNTFQKIRSFRRVDISTFHPVDPGVPLERALWRNETASRAREIVAIAATLIEDATTEMEVRLRLEQKVLARFNMIIECPSLACMRRLWRSEVEAEVEFPDRIAKSLADRRRDRRPCQCLPGERSSHVNKIFSSRADEMTSYDSLENDSEEIPKRRRPDRIFGFQETASFCRRLEKYNLLAGSRGAENETGLKATGETTQSTVLNHKGNFLLFPFLIIEAKSKKGGSFEDCNIQTAMPILKALKIQEDLQRKSQMTLEYGGPLVWYIAYRGEDWRLSGCYILHKPGGPSYEIVTLWTGQLNDVESTLQLLLIIDYIFDWARDIYKPSLISQLKILANESAEEDDHTGNDDCSRIDTDSDIFSLARPKQPRIIEDWGAALEDSAEVATDEELNLMKWASHDTDFGIFRPACTVQNVFRCLFVTKENIDELFSSVPKRCTVKQLAREAHSVLGYYDTVLVSEDVLDRIEEVWTNKARPKKTGHISETRLFASIVYHTDLQISWELQRIIYCVAFDEEALSKVKDYTQQKAPPRAFKYARRMGKSNAEALICALKNQTIQENLASALGTKRQQLRTIAGTSSSNPCPTFEFADVTYTPNGKRTYEVVDKVYLWCEKNLEEPSESFLRVSHQWSSLTGSSTGSTVASYFSNSGPKTTEQSVLVYRRYCSNVSLCIYVIPGLAEDTEPQRLQKALQKISGLNALYISSQSENNKNRWREVYKKWQTTDFGSCRDQIDALARWIVAAGLPTNPKRPHEVADISNVLTIQKKARTEIIIIDD